jgi:hypothetical protein
MLFLLNSGLISNIISMLCVHFMYYTQCVWPDDDVLTRSKHVTPLNTYIVSCVHCYYGITNLKHNGMYNMKKITQVHNIQTTNKMHFNVCGVLYSLNSHQHVSAAIAAIFKVMFDGNINVFWS